MSFNGALHMRTNHQIHCTSDRLVSRIPIVGLRNSERAPLTHCHQRAGSCAEQGALSIVISEQSKASASTTRADFVSAAPSALHLHPALREQDRRAAGQVTTSRVASQVCDSTHSTHELHTS